ncbi:hypothetical protein QBC37DRAFT_393618 [Rhypophila decipiens]|uniref:Aminoglycoside phosphotransferase domain-containing protein n=1 Tax=Rhypophila decipiens TaxID=261697 RepID=A0AAN6XT83_9PEZI|nr:hypothetical protein QBC37DRAFT_393618 [Rhypophila decipiens]
MSVMSANAFGSNPSHPDQRFWDCSIVGCSRSAAIDLGGCERCSSHFCVRHVDSTLHPCSKDPLDDDEWSAGREDELRKLRQMIKVDQLVAVASAARGGMECSLKLDDTEQVRMGGMHVHFPVHFIDGTVWLARVPRHTNFQSFSDQLTDEILLSECATLKWLEGVKLPAPKLGGYGLKGDPGNKVGVAFMLIECLPCNPFDRASATEDQKRKVFSQLGDLLTTLSQHPFDRIGSLTIDGDGSLRLGTVIGDRTGTLSRLGPFKDAAQYYVAWAEEYLRLVADGQLFGAFPVTAYLMFRYLRELGSQSLGPVETTQLDEGPFYLKHADDKGDHIMVDDEFNVTGVIDWSFAKAVPAYEAFGPSLVTADLGCLLDGKVGLNPDDLLLAELLEEKAHPYAHFARYGDRVRRFLFGPGTGMSPTEEEAVVIFKGIVETCGEQIGSWDEWRHNHLVEWSGDATLRRLTDSK